MNIFFDLDGTLIDSKMRLYSLFQSLVPESTLTFEEYWEFKSTQINHEEILQTKFNYSKARFAEFEDQWMRNIEQEHYLSLDTPFKGVTEFLEKLRQRNAIFLVTARQSEAGVLSQLSNFNWNQIFTGVFVTCQKWKKSELIQKFVSVSSDDWLVGDTGKDVQEGKRLGIRTAAVLSGFLNKEALLSYNPDVIRNTVIELEF